jgi:hypothetical protein
LVYRRERAAREDVDICEPRQRQRHAVCADQIRV